MVHKPSCSKACGIFRDQGLNSCPLHWQADSCPLDHQGSPIKLIKKKSPERKKMSVPYECPREYCIRAGVDVEQKILKSNTLSYRCLWSFTRSAILNTQHQFHLVTDSVSLTKVYSGSPELCQLSPDFWTSVFVSVWSNFSKNPLSQLNQNPTSSVSDHP